MNLKSLITAAALVVASAFAPVANATVYLSTDVPKTIADLGFASSVITINTHFILTDVNVLLDSLDHTYDADLLISIIGPTGMQVMLSNNRGGEGANFVNTMFDDSAPTAINAGAAPFTGSFRPDAALSAFNGLDAFGTWTLFVNDMVSGDSGTLNRWSLELAGAPTSVPEPGGIALLGLGLLGLAAARRKASK